jgi:hypothetical protein
MFFFSCKSRINLIDLIEQNANLEIFFEEFEGAFEKEEVEELQNL